MTIVSPATQWKLLERLLLPASADTRLLRTCLLTGAPAVEAFNAWSAGVDHPAVKFHAASGLRRRLLPLLQAGLARNGLNAPAELRPSLRAATLYEELRTEAYGEIAAQALHALRAADVPFLVVGGAVAAAMLYEKAARRHCHDIDLLLPPAALIHALSVLEQCRFRRDEALAQKPGDLLLLHESGLPLLLHTRALPAAAITLGTWEELRASAVTRTVFGVECATFRWEYTLLRVMLLGPLTASRDSMLWLCDACLLLSGRPIDWSVLTEAISGPAELITAVLVLTYLRREMGCAVPDETLAQLEKTWHNLPGSERVDATHVLVLTLVQAGAASPGWIWSRAQTAGERIAVLRALLFPSANILVRTESIRNLEDAFGYRRKSMARGLRWLRKNVSSKAV